MMDGHARAGSNDAVVGQAGYSDVQWYRAQALMHGVAFDASVSCGKSSG